MRLPSHFESCQRLYLCWHGVQITPNLRFQRFQLMPDYFDGNAELRYGMQHGDFFLELLIALVYCKECFT